jgi:hypothetical protein
MVVRIPTTLRALHLGTLAGDEDQAMRTRR